MRFGAQRGQHAADTQTCSFLAYPFDPFGSPSLLGAKGSCRSSNLISIYAPTEGTLSLLLPSDAFKNGGDYPK